jgi:thymidylate synthase
MFGNNSGGSDHGAEVLNRLTIERLQKELTAEECEIWYLWAAEELTFGEIGRIIGLKYRGKELTGSAIRYHRDRILEKLHAFKAYI